MRENGQLPEERAAAVKTGQVTTWENTTQCRFWSIYCMLGHAFFKHRQHALPHALPHA